MCEVENEERVLNGVLSDPTNLFVRTGSPNIICSVLPQHWRSNKQLPCRFKVVVLGEVMDNTPVTLSAANEFNDRGDLKNNVAHIKNHIAVFQDLRFIGRSGRGRRFHVVITVGTSPSQVAVYRDAIKVTIDGPRSPRNKGSISETKCNFERELSVKRKSSSDNDNVCSTQAPIAFFNDGLGHENDSESYENYKYYHNKQTKYSNDSLLNNTNDRNFVSPPALSTFPLVLSPTVPTFLPVASPHSLSGDSEYSSQSNSPRSCLLSPASSVNF